MPAAAAIAIPAAIKAGTSIASGLQARNANNDAVAALLKAFTNAGGIAQDAVDKVNPQILATADKAGTDVMGAGQAAAQNVVDAAGKGAADVREAVSQGQGFLQPYQTAGTGALDTLTRLLQKPEQFQYQADPGYQFRLAEGNKAIQRMAAAHGASGGGGTAKALMQYGSGLASTEFGNAWNRWNTGRQERIGGLTTLAGMGERAGEQSGDWGMRGAAFNAGLGTDAEKFAGQMRTDTTKWAGGANINAVDKTSQNSLDLANFLANLQINSGKTVAAGDIANSNIWSQLIPGLGQIGSDVITGIGKQRNWKGW